MLQVGGVINLPIFTYNTDNPGEEFKCYNDGEILERINNVTKVMLTNPDNLNLIKQDLNKIIPLYNFKNVIAQICETQLKGTTKFVLDDFYLNHIFFSEFNIINDEIIHWFQILDTLQIKYNGTTTLSAYKKSKSANHIYSFSDFINYNHNKLNKNIALYDCEAILQQQVLSIFKKKSICTLNIDNHNPEDNVEDNLEDNQDANLQIEDEKPKDINLVDFNKFLNNYIIFDQQNFQIVRFHENFDIIYFMFFINMTNELFILIDNYYDYINSNKVNSIADSDLEEIRKIIRETGIIINKKGVDMDFIKKIIKLSNPTINKIDLINSIYHIKYIYPSIIDDDVKELCDTIEFINKLEGIKSKINSNIKLIINAYNYKKLGEAYKFIKNNTGISTNFNVFNKTTKLEEEYIYISFIQDIQKLLTSIKKTRDEFVKNNICFYNDCVKAIIGQCYYDFIKKKDVLNYFPISLQTHSLSYNTESEKYISIKENNKTINDIIHLKMFTTTINNKFELFKEKIIVVSKISFNSCGEKNLLNLIKYILSEKIDINILITTRNLNKLNTIFPENRLKTIFNDQLLKYTTDLEQTKYLEDKLNDFAKIISGLVIPADRKIYNRETTELIPTIENNIFMLKHL